MGGQTEFELEIKEILKGPLIYRGNVRQSEFLLFLVICKNFSFPARFSLVATSMRRMKWCGLMMQGGVIIRWGWPTFVPILNLPALQNECSSMCHECNGSRFILHMLNAGGGWAWQALVRFPQPKSESARPMI